jgi:hypothetical protein
MKGVVEGSFKFLAVPITLWRCEIMLHAVVLTERKGIVPEQCSLSATPFPPRKIFWLTSSSTLASPSFAFAS